MSLVLALLLSSSCSPANRRFATDQATTAEREEHGPEVNGPPGATGNRDTETSGAGADPDSTSAGSGSIATHAGPTTGRDGAIAAVPDSSGNSALGPDSRIGDASVARADGCASNPCLHGLCLEDGESYSCDCAQSGFTGPHCEVDIDECVNKPCGPTERCSNTPGSFICSECPSGDPAECGNINKCEQAPCDPLTACEDTPAGFRCGPCPEGYSGTGETGCENIDECATNPCVNGTCLDRIGRYECDCLSSGYSGKHCEVLIENCTVSPCENGGACEPSGNSRTCDCTGTGATGTSCEVDTDECASDPCVHGTCIDGVGEFTCDCSRTDYEGTRCEDRIDDCSPNPCRNGGECTDGERGFSCDCSDTDFEGDTCTDRIDDCSPNPCRNGGECTDGERGFSCDCSDTDFGGDTCTDRIDDCSPNPCRNGGECTDGERGFSCDCSDTDFGGDTCTDRIDDCSPNPCRNGGECTDGERGFTCDCAGTGYTGPSCSEDIDDCSPDPCLNGNRCIDDGANAFICECDRPWSGPLCGTGNVTAEVFNYGYYTTKDGASSSSVSHTGAQAGYAPYEEYRSYLVFSVPDFDGEVASVSLVLLSWFYPTEDDSEPLGVFSVSTPISQLGSTSNGLSVFDDLGSGTRYGIVDMNAGNANTDVKTRMDSLKSLVANARGEDLALGVTALDLRRDISGSEYVTMIWQGSGSGELQIEVTPP